MRKFSRLVLEAPGREHRPRKVDVAQSRAPAPPRQERCRLRDGAVTTARI